MHKALWLSVALLLVCFWGPVDASQKKKEEAEFLLLLKTLPGDYDNLAQAESAGDAMQHAAVVLSIKPVEETTVGKLVMFVHETAANDPHRVLAQRIWTLERDKQNHIVQKVFLFKEPRRWMNAADDPLVLRSLLAEDLQQLSGCELLWTKTPNGFSAAVRPEGCRPASLAEGVLVQTSASLQGDDLTMNEVQAGHGGRLPTDATPVSLYHFQRRGG
jgi:hypothetical protein